MLGVVINGGDAAEPGTALLIAAAPVGRGRLIDASSVLPTLAAVPPSALTGTPAATVIELADPLDPQTVLTRIRAAATAEGPLSLYLAGQLQLDRKQRLLHLALARTTPTTMRYTALPWHWLAGELAIRRPGSTTVVVDLVADPEAWRHLGEAGLALGHGIRLFGRITPASPRRGAAAPAYLKACAEIWRSGARPDLAALHEQAAARAGGEESLLPAVGAAPPLGAPGGQALAAGMALPVAASAARSTAPVAAWAARSATPAGVPAVRSAPVGAVAAGSSDPHPAILAAAQAGRHSEAAAAAAAWEQQELRIHGPGSVQAIHWLEVRADLARLAQDPALSCELWMTAAAARLTRRQAPDDPDVEGAVDRAHHQWEQIRDLPRARALAPVLVRLRRDVPGRQRGALQVLQRRLESLHAGRP
ncbi:hypothetical protein HRW11_31810 [Streptomyces lunaelactis]|uniref:hypothetical protein n=1 Tax=Streptomyces lunaelactis TaxID=1535768 RepID=UPI001584625B|nr:hypothetical protein [Streptomyces lunaelactis]NUK68578.1 hypothetical protein [Streptomyces lunaelactis]